MKLIQDLLVIQNSLKTSANIFRRVFFSSLDEILITQKEIFKHDIHLVFWKDYDDHIHKIKLQD